MFTELKVCCFKLNSYGLFGLNGYDIKSFDAFPINCKIKSLEILRCFAKVLDSTRKQKMILNSQVFLVVISTK